MSEGAVDLGACPTKRSRFGRCCCGPCKVCGFAKHSGAHGPFFGHPPGSKPYLHEYEPEIDDHAAIDAARGRA